MFKALIAFLFLFSSSGLLAAEQNRFAAFFERYESLGREYDTSLAQLYADDAKITGVRILPDGSEKTLNFDGKKWKQLIVDLMPVAKERGDGSRFSGIAISEEGDTAKISATRYSELKCHADKDYYMMAKARPDGQIEIIEEYSRSPQKSACQGPVEDDLSILLRAMVEKIEKRLPLMLDEDTKLESVTSADRTLVYLYELVKLASTEVDQAALAGTLKAALVKQSCTTAGLKSILGQGGTISYRYNGKDKLKLVEINVDKLSCP